MAGDESQRRRLAAMGVSDPGDDSSVPTSVRVVRSVAVATDTPPTELPPLHQAIDTDALDQLFPWGNEGNCLLSFRYANVGVHVSGDGGVRVTYD